MKKYTELLSNHLWTLTEFPAEGNDGITVSDKNGTFELMIAEYAEDVYNDILKQAAEYVHVAHMIVYRNGNTDEDRTDRKDISHNSIIVKNNSFAGMLTLCILEGETHQHTVRFDECKGILFADGTAAGINYDLFEGDPGAFRVTTEHSLVKR